VGDVLWAKRSPLGEHHLYHHAGVVTRVDAHGRPVEVVDFGPGGEGEDIPLRLALTTGFEAEPRLLEGAVAIESIFPPGHTFIYARVRWRVGKRRCSSAWRRRWGCRGCTTSNVATASTTPWR
jgi:hypothetical protein